MLKPLYFLLSFSLFSLKSSAQEVFNIPEPKKDSATLALEKTNSFSVIEQGASFPGGIERFYGYIANKIKIPELVSLFGFNGRIVAGFTVGKDGYIKDVKAFSDSATGFEENLIAAISNSTRWLPAIQNGIKVEQKFTLPFKFDISKPIIDLKELKRSSYKFQFQVNDKTYDLKNAEAILGNVFSADKIDYIKSFSEQSAENRKAKKYIIFIKPV
ncbi:energy transducer TonB [Mucilaginibacter litoreus]|uniref:Energy transducer TonB n=1 Tax=Mucilaginibacter litoreus TaxID=1048221 RepID=A0ABW3ARE8_9SPHI